MKIFSTESFDVQHSQKRNFIYDGKASRRRRSSEFRSIFEETLREKGEEVPEAREIFIKLGHEHHSCNSKIHIQMPGKILHAEKKAPTLSESMELAYHPDRQTDHQDQGKETSVAQDFSRCRS